MTRSVSAVRNVYTGQRCCSDGRFPVQERNDLLMGIANEEEILAYLTYIMRREDEDIKLAESFKAAELLGKYYGMFSDKHNSEAVGDVIIVDNIAEKENGIPS